MSLTELQSLSFKAKTSPPIIVQKKQQKLQQTLEERRVLWDYYVGMMNHKRKLIESSAPLLCFDVAQIQLAAT